MIMKITKRKDVLTNQEKGITIKTNTIFRFKPFINHENGRVRSHNCDRTFIKKRVINIYVKKDDRDRTEL